MLRQIEILSRKKGTTFSEFKERYERDYPPLISAHRPQLGPFRRNFLIPGGTVQGGHIENTPPSPPFDVITQAPVNSAADSIDARQNAEFARAIRTIEHELLDMSCTLRFYADERSSPPEDLGSALGAPDDGSMIKMMILLKRKAGMSRESFIDYYETKHAPLAAKHLWMLGGYRRSYVIPVDDIKQDVDVTGVLQPEIDVITEMWFRSQAGYDGIVAVMSDSTLGPLFANDEANFLDRSNIRMFMVEERVP
jgi:hypothetical protein